MNTLLPNYLSLSIHAALTGKRPAHASAQEMRAHAEAEERQDAGLDGAHNRYRERLRHLKRAIKSMGVNAG